MWDASDDGGWEEEGLTQLMEGVGQAAVWNFARGGGRVGSLSESQEAGLGC